MLPASKFDNQNTNNEEYEKNQDSIHCQNNYPYLPMSDSHHDEQAFAYWLILQSIDGDGGYEFLGPYIDTPRDRCKPFNQLSRHCKKLDIASEDAIQLAVQRATANSRNEQVYNLHRAFDCNIWVHADTEKKLAQILNGLNREDLEL